MSSVARRHSAFSLIEIMIAIVFISIGFFGYVALHSRILHSGQKLEEKEIIRASTDFFESIEVARVMYGKTTSINGLVHQEQVNLERFYRISTSNQNRDVSWRDSYPPKYHPGIEDTMELSPNVLMAPNNYEWDRR